MAVDTSLPGWRPLAVRAFLVVVLGWLAPGVGGAVPASGPAPQHSHVLWQIVHERCVPAAHVRHPPAPCTRLWLTHGVQHGYALLKDRRGREQYLLIPTARVSGIESPALLSGALPNYFAAAWRARHYVGAALGRALPRDDIALAINSAQGRTQDQLHIHIDCVGAGVRRRLDRIASRLGPRWQDLHAPLQGHHYRALRVYGRDLDVDPIRLLADALPGRGAMGEWTMVVVGHTFAGHRPGFVILAARASAHNYASGEELMDHRCAVATTAARASR